MNVTYEVFVTLYQDGRLLPGVGAFVERFGSSGSKQPGAFSFRDRETARQAIDVATMEHFDPQLFYFFSVNPENLATSAGFYLALDVEEEIVGQGRQQSDLLANVEVALDLCSDSILVNGRLKNLLEKNTREVKFSAIDETVNGWFRVDQIAELPEPIIIPNPMYFSPNENPPGTYAVQSDGRDVLTETNLAWVREGSLAVSSKVKTPAAHVAWRPRVVISGSLLALLLKEKVRGLTLPPVPLLTAEQAAAAGL